MSREVMTSLLSPQEKPERAKAPLIVSPVASLLLAAACAPSYEVQAAKVPNLLNNAPREQQQGISSGEQFLKEQGLTATGVLSQTEAAGGGILPEPPVIADESPAQDEPPEGGKDEAPPAEPAESPTESQPPAVEPESEPEPEPAPAEEVVSSPAPDTAALEWLRATNVGTLKLDNWGLDVGQGSYKGEQLQIYNSEKTLSRHYIRELGKTIRRIGDPELARMYAHIVQGNEDGSIRLLLVPSFQVTNLPEHFTPFGWDIGVNSGATRLRISGGQIQLEKFTTDKYDGVFWVDVSEAVIDIYQDRRDAGEDIITIYSSKRNVVDAAIDALKRALVNFNRLKSRLERLGISWSTSTGGPKEWSRFFDANQNNPLALRQRVNKDLAINATPQELR